MLAGVEDQVVLVGPDPLAEGQAVPEGQLDVAVTLAHASPPLGRPLRRSPGTRASCVPCPQTPGTSADNSRARPRPPGVTDRKSTRLNSSHLGISYAVFCLKKKKL